MYCNKNFIYHLFCGAIKVVAVSVSLCLSVLFYYVTDHYIILWKTEMWKHAPESQVIEEVKYLIRKHSDCSDLDTLESIINESIRIRKYSLDYRTDCYRRGLHERVKTLENV